MRCPFHYLAVSSTVAYNEYGCRCGVCAKKAADRQSTQKAQRKSKNKKRLRVTNSKQTANRKKQPTKSAQPMLALNLTQQGRNETWEQWQIREWVARQNHKANAKQLQEREVLHQGNTSKLLALEERANRYAWATRAISRDRCEKLNIQVNLTVIEQQEELEIYKKCYILSANTSIPHEVDHRIPLSRGGQHHPQNLQILTRAENRRKGAKLL